MFIDVKYKNDQIQIKYIEPAFCNIIYSRTFPVTEAWTTRGIRKYLEFDEYGAYKKSGVKMPFWYWPEYSDLKIARQKQIFIKLFSLSNTTFCVHKGDIYWSLQKGYLEIPSDKDLLEAFSLLRME